MRRPAACLVALTVLTAPAVAEHVKQPTCGDPVVARPSPRGLADVDWCNHDFKTFKGPLRRGRNSLHLYRKLGEPHDTITTSLRGVVYGDLDGDGKPEAAVVLETTTWIAHRSEPGGSVTVYLFGFGSGGPRLLGTVGTGRPVEDIAFGKGTITITSGTPRTTQRFRRAPKTTELVEITSP